MADSQTKNNLIPVPLVSCLMVTQTKRIHHAKRGLRMFLEQTWPRRELVVVCADEQDNGQLRKMFEDAQSDSIHPIRYYRVDWQPLGDLRNKTLEKAQGDYTITWDDDDIYHPDRILYQMEGLRRSKADVCFLVRITLHIKETENTEGLTALGSFRPWENSLLCKRDVCVICYFWSASVSVSFHNSN